jgi:hypothetical protein
VGCLPAPRHPDEVHHARRRHTWLGLGLGLGLGLAAHGLNVSLRPRPQGFTMPAKWHSLTILCASAAALVERISSSGSSGHGGSSRGICAQHFAPSKTPPGSPAHQSLGREI